jgi:hypothetical protein
LPFHVSLAPSVTDLLRECIANRGSFADFAQDPAGFARIFRRIFGATADGARQMRRCGDSAAPAKAACTRLRNFIPT